VEEGFDLAIRIGSIAQQGLVSHRLGRTQIVCCASPGYLARHGTPQTPEDLASHDCLSYTLTPVPNTWRFEGPGDSGYDLHITPRHRANSGRMLTQLAALDVGVVMEPDFIVSPEVKSGALVRLLPKYALPHTRIAAVYPSRRHLSAKVRTFVDFLADRFRREQPWTLEG
jgi:DNA-binding transcriptional LysR family regulator